MINRKLEIYGVQVVTRPKIKVTKQIDLSGDFGRQIVKSETELVLRTYPKTFQKLADM